MSFNNWAKIRLEEAILINPTENLDRGEQYKKIGMSDLEPFNRKIKGYSISNYKGGSRFRNEDSLVARITPCLENGKTAKVDILEKGEVAFGSTEFIVLRRKNNISDANYIYYFAISPQFRDLAIKSMTGTSGRQRVQLDVVKDMLIDLPPIHEQKAIASILSSLDEKIEVNNKINQTLEEIAQAIFHQWFVEFEFPNEEGEPYKSSGGEMVKSELGMIPKGWQVESLSDVADYLNGRPMQKHRPAPDEDKSLPVMKIRELRQGLPDEKSDRCSVNLEEKYIVKDGDVIFSWSGSLLVDLWCGGKVGLNQHLFKVTSKTYDKWFIYLWTKHFLDVFIHIAESKATTMGHIKRKDLKDAKVAIPKEVVYCRAKNILEPLIDYIVVHKIQSRELSITRDTLLPKLMSGEIRVPLEED